MPEPDHRAEAVQLLQAAKQHDNPTVGELVATARVHALLDLADAIRSTNHGEAHA